jgi:protein-histidine N-methyltransferase
LPFLHLITVPNILLTWYVCRHPEAEPVSDLDIDSQLVNEFRSDLSEYGLSFTFISGEWSAEWVDFAFPLTTKDSGEFTAPGTENGVGKGYTLIFTSETIYDPTSVPDIVDVLVSILERAGEHHHDSASYPNPKALVAAKKLYFGVGGGVDFFHTVLKKRAGERIKVVEKVDVTDEGVGRVVWEIELTGGGPRSSCACCRSPT